MVEHLNLRYRSRKNISISGENWRDRESSGSHLVLRRLKVKTEPKDLGWGPTRGKMSLRSRKKLLDKSNGNWEVSRKSNLRKRTKSINYKTAKGSSSSVTESNDSDDSDSSDNSDDSQDSVSDALVSEERSDRTPTFELISD